MLENKDFQLSIFNLINEIINGIIHKKMSVKTLNDLAERLELAPPLLEMINIVNDIFDEVRNHFGFENKSGLVSLTDEQSDLLNQTILTTEYQLNLI